MKGLRQTTGVASEGTGRGGPEPAPTPLLWSGRRDLNPRPQRPERCALPSCATSRAVRQSSGSPRPTVRAGRGWSSSSVASGRQKNRNGAYLLVPRPGRDVHDRAAHAGSARSPGGTGASSSSRGRRRPAGTPGRRGCGRRPAGRSRGRRSPGRSRVSASTANPNDPATCGGRPAGRARRCAHRPGRAARRATR